MNKKTIMAVPAACFFIIIGVCILGIIIGSFCDFDISVALANPTDLGTYFATYSPFLAYALLPAGGACIYTGLIKKSDRYTLLARVIVVWSWFMAVYYSNSYFGKNVRKTIGYEAGDSSAFLAVVCWLIWAVAYSWIPFVIMKLLDDSDPDKLIAVGAALIMATITSDVVMQWLKQVASRPRYKYLVTLDDPASEYRNWWKMVPYLAGQNDGFMSWPSGHMSIVGTLFGVPLLTDCMKNRSEKINLISFICAFIFIILCGYNRIHMTNHFLSDVCFGTMHAYLITAGISTAFMKTYQKTDESRKTDT